MDTQPRQPPGIPTGGRYAEHTHGTGDVVLGFARRAQLLEGSGYVPAIVMPSTSDPRSSTRAREWWDRARISAEYGSGIPQMQDLIDGPVQRRHYGNDRIKLRMPAVSTIRACAAAAPGTFDIPVSMSLAGANPVQGWVRATPGPNGTWDITTLGGDGPAAAELAEAVTAVLESRRPTQALAQAGDLLESHARRMSAKRRAAATAGVPMKEVNSSFINEVGYDPASQTLATRIGERIYGHRVPREVFEVMKESENPGIAFNRLVRGRSQGVAVTQCGSCRRFHSPLADHTCPVDSTAAHPAAPANPGSRREAMVAAFRRSLVPVRRRKTPAAPPVRQTALQRLKEPGDEF